VQSVHLLVAQTTDCKLARHTYLSYIGISARIDIERKVMHRI